MASPTKLTNEQREALLTWLAAEYDTRLIRKWFAEREWPELKDELIHYYRKAYKVTIDTLRTARRAEAITTGLALKEERVRRLAEHADTLEAIKWVPDEKGRLHNEKAWRETLDDIAAEMGQRKQGGAVLNVTPDDLKDLSDQELDELARKRGLLEK